ncbi:hypothetical protein K1W54_21745 [Micromonospora sp. CPCC 205371]|nr:hypothetical protein [Micromonospora sp. CPCC 205371]
MSTPVDQAPDGWRALAVYGRGYLGRVRGGELGSIPALAGLAVITAVFAAVHQGFLSAYNIEALVIQAAPIIVMAMGLVAVLLLGDIDLSAGTTGGLCSAIAAVLMLRHGVPWWLGIAIGGTSLFGGRGRVIDAVLGGLVVAVIINGMSDLIQGANSAGYEWVVTGAVLLLAAGFDAVVRRVQPR